MKNTKIQTCYTFKIKTAYAECVLADGVTSSLAVIKLYNLEISLFKFYFDLFIFAVILVMTEKWFVPIFAHL